jgi:hypothetical protein
MTGVLDGIDLTGKYIVRDEGHDNIKEIMRVADWRHYDEEGYSYQTVRGNILYIDKGTFKFGGRKWSNRMRGSKDFHARPATPSEVAVYDALFTYMHGKDTLPFKPGNYITKPATALFGRQIMRVEEVSEHHVKGTALMAETYNFRREPVTWLAFSYLVEKLEKADAEDIELFKKAEDYHERQKEKG